MKIGEVYWITDCSSCSESVAETVANAPRSAIKNISTKNSEVLWFWVSPWNCTYTPHLTWISTSPLRLSTL